MSFKLQAYSATASCLTLTKGGWPLVSGFGGKPITGAAHGLYQIFICLGERLAQTANVNVYRTLFDVHVAAPDLIQ